MIEFLLGILVQPPPVHTLKPIEVVAVAQAAEPIVYTLEEEKERPECNCVLGVRHFSPYPMPFIDASKYVGNSTPTIGGVIILKYNVWHVAVITEFTDVGFRIREYNYRHCEETTRIIPYNDYEHIRGFYMPPSSHNSR